MMVRKMIHEMMIMKQDNRMIGVGIISQPVTDDDDDENQKDNEDYSMRMTLGNIVMIRRMMITILKMVIKSQLGL